MAPPEIGKLSEDEQKLFQCITSGSLEEIKALLGQPGVRVDCLDQSGMTPLQQAAYQGRNDICKLLLAHGADVNSNQHQHGYTALMFAALSGNIQVTQTMLEAGANVYAENTVHRTAAQMAAFVGQSQCTVVINNFIPKSEIEYYCKPQGLETEPKLPPHLGSPLYDLVKHYNIHPVKLSMILQSYPELLVEVKKVQKVLDLLVEKMVKRKERNEVLAVKFHYISVLVQECAKWQSKKQDNLEGWIKRLCKGREPDGFLEVQEKLIRSMIKSFPYLDSQLIQQIVKTLAAVEIGDSPTALSVLNSALNGQQFASSDDQVCNTCAEMKAEKRCSACKSVFYCNVRCQKLDWTNHKKMCKTLQEERKKMEESKKQEVDANKENDPGSETKQEDQQTTEDNKTGKPDESMKTTQVKEDVTLSEKSEEIPVTESSNLETAENK